MRRLVLLPVVAALALTPAASAGPVVDRAATALERNPVYVDPAAAKTISPADAARLRTEIRTRAHGPVYIAVLPAAALDEEGGDPLGILDALYTQIHRRAVYAVVAGGEFRAESVDLGSGVAGKLASEAYDAHGRQGIAETLIDFVDRVGDRRAGRDRGGGGLGRIGLLPLILLAGVAFLVYRTFRRRRKAASELREVKETVRQDLNALADDVQQLEAPVERDGKAKEDYLAALDRYGRASSALERARTPQQLAPVAEALEEGRYLMASAEARLAGKQPPERRPPCFFDPRHGPSVRDVPWSPGEAGATRDVPACAACAVRVEEGSEPEARQVLVAGRAMPYWMAGPMYGGYFGGFFPGLLLGEMLGGFGFGGYGFGGYGFGGPFVGGYGDGGGYDSGGDGDFDGGLGDFGGGDFGGGDGGGGDF